MGKMLPMKHLSSTRLQLIQQPTWTWQKTAQQLSTELSKDKVLFVETDATTNLNVAEDSSCLIWNNTPRLSGKFELGTIVSLDLCGSVEVRLSCSMLSELWLSHSNVMPPGLTSVEVQNCEDRLTQALPIHLAEDGHSEIYFDLEMKLLATRMCDQM